jgi:hypothetical protein
MTDEKTRQLQPLGGASTDPAKAMLKGVLSGIPLVGGVISEIVGQLIRDQRMDRLEDYVRRLSDDLSGLAESEVRQRLTEPENLDLFEDGAMASARALSDDKRERIARLVAYGISGDEQAGIEAKRLLQLITRLGDDQIIRLTSYLHRHQRDTEFRAKHASVLEPVFAHHGSTREELDRALVQDMAKAELIDLGLLREQFKKPKKGELPEFDEKTGRMKAGHRDLSPLGRLLLRRIGLAEQDEF